ncbi:GBP domain containing protein [Asbolus verrucosus]|uniref:GBP domain containing protein n=1 Tax=Asbolus verrucosus TaxID=1661398 RepID=A0A482VV10_ASBVE|nr:GBP domain containing protein [Asbolus verrucosus]
MEEPHAVKIIDINLENQILPKVEILEKLLLQDGIKDKKVCVVSVTGTCRQGKSFILNFFIRYLNVRYKKKIKVAEWLTPHEGPISGFQWRSGSQRHTVGILMWSEIFLAELSSGEEVAVIVLDTQGTFDNVSSHFSGYGRLLVDDNEDNTSPFQNLLFLIRDWSCEDEHKFGAEGGQQYLNQELLIREDQAEDVVALKKNIKELFQKTKCFLLPHPGRAVASSKNFQGKIDPEFKDYVQLLIPMLLSPENLALKTLNGEKIKVADLFRLIVSYSQQFQDGTMPELQSIFEASSEVHNTAVVDESVALYEKCMQFVKNNNYGSLDKESLEEEHQKNKSEALKYFRNKKKMGNKTMIENFERILIEYKLKKTNVSNWLNSADGPISGFPWRGGSERHTIGILMWSEIFLSELPSGEEIAIILLDTQGSFDNATSLTHCAAVFALSTLISSVQIYNLKEDIKQYDLAHLEESKWPHQDLHFKEICKILTLYLIVT